jgi:hypothetical protein
MIIKLTGATKGAENIEKIEAELSEMAQSFFFSSRFRRNGSIFRLIYISLLRNVVKLIFLSNKPSPADIVALEALQTVARVGRSFADWQRF